MRLEHKHSRAIRWFHWIHFPVLALMIWSGLLIYWAHDVYRVGIGSWTVFHFFPNWFYEDGVALPIHVAFPDQRFAARGVHGDFRRVAVSGAESKFVS